MNKKYLIIIVVLLFVWIFWRLLFRDSGTPVSTPIIKSVFTDTKHRIQFAYPEEMSLTGGEVSSTTEWKQLGDRVGDLLVTFTLPREFQPKTNFSEAKFTVGKSAEKDAVQNCLVEPNATDKDGVEASTQNVHFTLFTMGDAGAGNFYETKSYRVVHDNECYVVEYTIHSTNLGNYSPEQGITAFDKVKMETILEEMVRSFMFM